MKNEIGDFLDYLTYERNVSVNTITAYRDDLESLISFLCNDYLTLGRDQLDFTVIDHLAIRSYLAHLARRKLARASAARHLSAIRSFFKYLMREGVVEANPARSVATPKREKHLPTVLQPADVALLIEQPDTSNPLGLRDRAFLEQLEGAIECMKKDGTLVKLYEKWYGSKVDPGSSISTIFPGWGPPGFKGYDATPHELSCK